MKAKPQGKLEGTFLGSLLKTRLAVIAANWVFQGMRYMNFYEVTLKLLIDLLLSLLIIRIMPESFSLPVSAVLSLSLAHTLNWVFNGHFFVLMRYVAPIAKTEESFEEFINLLKKSALRWSSIDGVAIYGSYCRGSLHKYSDLDVRVISRPGAINMILVSLFCLVQRFIAFFKVFPLDVYGCSNVEFLDRLREDEKPVILIDNSGQLRRKYQLSEEN